MSNGISLDRVLEDVVGGVMLTLFVFVKRIPARSINLPVIIKEPVNLHPINLTPNVNL